MSTNNRKTGEVSWGETKIYEPGGNNNKPEWMRLKKGSNKVRVLTAPFQYYQHTVHFDGGNKFGYRVNCSATKDNSACPVCEKGGEDGQAKRRWLIGVIDRETNTYKILDIAQSVLKGIKILNDDKDWGDPINYDIDILNSGIGAQRYNVVAKPKTPLSAEDLVLQGENTTDALAFRTTPPSYEKVEERLAKIREDISNNGSDDNDNDSSDGENQDDDNFFKDYQGKTG